MDLSYIINQLGEDRENYYEAISPPVIQSSNFAFKNVADMRNQLADEFNYTLYSRGNNPTTNILRKKIAALEQGEDALILSSGSSAVSCAITANVNAGDHIVCVDNPYTWTKKLLNDILPRFNVVTTYVDGTDTRNFINAIQPNTKIIYLESPNSFTFELQDIEAIASLSKKRKILTIVDNSYATPLNQQPITMGADMVVHSVSKYLNGHSDVVAGVIVGKKNMIRKIFDNEFMTFGPNLSPWDAWLVLRGLRTLEIRMERVSESAEKIVEFLKNHSLIENVYYPLAGTNTQYKLARKQLKNSAGMFTIKLKVENVNAVETFCNHLKRFQLAVSWGGHESLVFPACAAMKSREHGFDLVRVSIGLEDPEILIEDLRQALSFVKK